MMSVSWKNHSRDYTWKTLKNPVKLWNCPLPKKSLTLANVGRCSDKKFRCAIARGRLVPQPFKMALPSTARESVSNSVPDMNLEGTDAKWQALLMILSSASSAEPAAVNVAFLVKNTPEKEEIQKA
jgi:hypothetical protein